MGDLELSLRQLQQDVCVPEVVLPIHPTIKAVITKAIEEGRKPTVQDFADKYALYFVRLGHIILMF